jgi:hypothetical protein
VVGNVVFAGAPLEGGIQAHNFTGEFGRASAYLRNPYATPGTLDVSLRSEVSDASVWPAATRSEFLDADRDFDGMVRQTGLPGAFASTDREHPLDSTPSRAAVDRR